MKKVLIKLNSSTGIGTLECVGFKTFNCGGKCGCEYVCDVTIDPKEKGVKQELHISQEYNGAKMPWSVLFNWKKGIFIHQWPCLENSSGCIHLLEGDAKEFYDWIDCKTNIKLEWCK